MKHLYSLRLLSCCVALSMFSAMPASGQGDDGFLRGKGNLDAALSYSLDSYDEFWVGSTSTKSPAVGTVTRAATNLYTAYGLTDDIDLVFNGSYVAASSDGTGGIPREQGLQDGLVVVKWRFLEHETDAGVFSVLAAPGFKFPLSNYENNAVTAIGDGSYDLQARVIGTFRRDLFFAAVETGYDFRNQAPPNAFPLHVSTGIAAERYLVAAFYSLVDSVSGYDIGQGPFPGLEEDYQRLGIRGYLRIFERLGLTASVFTTLDGRNTGDVDSVALGLVYRF